MRKQISENCQPRQAKQVRMGNRSHMSSKIIDEVLTYLANKRGGMAVINAAAKQARSNWARHAAKALWEKRRACGTGDYAIRLVSRLNAPASLTPEDHHRSSAPNACNAEANAA
jgi:hypothetical protein